MRFIPEAIKAIDRGSYGECIRCNEDISEKRLDAVLWATMCVHCQEESEAQKADSRMVLAGQEAEETDL